MIDRQPLASGGRGFDLLNSAVQALGFFRAPLSAREMIAAARRETDLADFGEWDIEEPLTVLIASYERESNLNAFGRMAARWDMRRFLSNLLRFREEERRNPKILARKIERPIFITGMPRSGTSFLHELLCQDASNAAVRCWETIYPFPLKRSALGDADRRRRKVDRQLQGFKWIAPEIASLHPITADSPQECTEITGHVFRSLRFDTTHVVPSYRRWLEQQSQLAPYRFHKRYLQHLQPQGETARWVLKSPDHIFSLDELRAVYPDARFVFMHRDPLSVLPSVARLTETLRRPFTTRLDRRQIGSDVCQQWTKGAAILADTVDGLAGLPEPPLHFRFRDFVRDPLASVETLYRHFGLPLDAETHARIARHVAAKPKGGNGFNHGRLEDYGLDADRERTRFAGYTSSFKLAA